MISFPAVFRYNGGMSYLVLARKYRPQVFEDVVAQEHVTRTLRNAIKNDRVGGGYLFCGPRGTGKTTVARILAKAINCEKGPTENPCGECSSCLETTIGTSLDVLEIDAASNTGVDDIRTLRENVRYLPTGGGKRIYIIDEVHRLSGSAFDALLKTLEEPPSHVVFIFATTDPLKVPETILSRTQRFDFRRVSVGDLSAHMKDIAGREDLSIDNAALDLLARKAEGSVRDSLSLLDQIAAFAGSHITENDVVNALGLVDRVFLFSFVETVAEADKGKSIRLVKDLFDRGVDVSDFLTELLEHFRCLLVLSTDEGAGDLLNLSQSELAEYKVQAEHFSVGDILRMMKIATDIGIDLKAGLNERLLLEMAAVKMADLESTVRFEDVLSEMATLTGAPRVSAEEKPGQASIFPSASQKKNELKDRGEGVAETEGSPGIPTRSVNLPQIRAGWDKFLALMRESNRMLASQLSMAEISSVKDNEMLLVFAPSAGTSMELVSKPESIATITGLLREHYKANVRIRFEVDPDKPDEHRDLGNGQPPRIDAKKIVEQSPRLQKLLKLVDGEVIGVREVE